MATELVPGQNIPLPGPRARFTARAGAAADFSAFRTYSDGKTRVDEDFIFYGQKNVPDGSVALEAESSRATFDVNMAALPAAAEKVAFTVTSDFPSVASLGTVSAEIAAGGQTLGAFSVNLAGRDEKALILGEIYKRGADWKFRCICQGFREGLKALAEFYGVEIADEPAPPSRPAVNLSKVVLTKESPRVNLAKKDVQGGVFRVNLNWNQGRPKGGLGRFFGGGGGIDLDLGAYVRLKDGDQTIVQALGEDFGALDSFPYVQLMGDDRTGAQSEGEWIYINGDKLDKIAEIVIYAFIYEGVPNWSATDGVVRVEIPGQPEIETRLTGTDNKLPMCAIARITNGRDGLSVERLDRYFRGHRFMDEAYGWGFSWSRGSK